MPARERKSLSVAPGSMAVTLTPCSFISSRSPSANENVKALVGPYTVSYGVGRVADTEEVMRTRPPRRRHVAYDELGQVHHGAHLEVDECELVVQVDVEERAADAAASVEHGDL
jgi:hypothetical protein